MCFKGEDSSIEWASIIVPKTEALSFSYDERNWEVRVSGLAVESMFSDRESKLPIETGGAIIGRICELTNKIYVTGTIPLSEVFVQSPTEYSINQKQLADIDENVRLKTRCRAYVIGTWHSHITKSEPSDLDAKTLTTLNEQFNLPVVTMLMCDGEKLKIVNQSNKV